MAPGIFDSLFNLGLFPNFNSPRDFFKSWQYRLIHWIKTVFHLLDLFPLQEDYLFYTINSLKKLNNKDSKRNHTWALSIVKIWHVFCKVSLHSFSGRTGPEKFGGPVRKDLNLLGPLVHYQATVFHLSYL